MGLNNYYAELKQFGTKNVTFKQEQLMEKAVNGKYVTRQSVGISDEEHLRDPTVFTSLWKGVCAGVSMNWLAQKLTRLVKPVFVGSSCTMNGESADLTKEERNLYHTKSISRIAPIYKAMYNRVNADRWSMLKATDELAGEWGLKIDAGMFEWNVKKNKSVSSLFTDFNKSLGTGAGVYIAYEFKTDGGWHAVALYRKSPTEFEFLDPNIGEYSVRRDRYDAFFKKYLELVASTMQSELSDSYAYPVVRR